MALCAAVMRKKLAKHSRKNFNFIIIPFAIMIVTFFFLIHLTQLYDVQLCSQGPLSTSRKYPGYSWSCVYASQHKLHGGWVLNLILSTLSREVNVALLQTLIF